MIEASQSVYGQCQNMWESHLQTKRRGKTRVCTQLIPQLWVYIIQIPFEVFTFQLST